MGLYDREKYGTDQDEKPKSAGVAKAEATKTGAVGSNTYIAFFRAMGWWRFSFYCFGKGLLSRFCAHH
eukprot:SAG31_NODE_3790_length_3878_cov_1.766931_5_plen_68_part_00